MVNARMAGRLLGGLSDETMRTYAESGFIPAERIGKRGIYRFKIDEIRKFAIENQRSFNEILAAQVKQTDQ